METTKELLHCLESHRMSPSDVFILDHMKTLLLVQDTGRLKRALEMFPEHCLMPPGKCCTVQPRLSTKTAVGQETYSAHGWKKRVLQRNRFFVPLLDIKIFLNICHLIFQTCELSTLRAVFLS
jgi:hypothetical protein